VGLGAVTACNAKPPHGSLDQASDHQMQGTCHHVCFSDTVFSPQWKPEHRSLPAVYCCCYWTLSMLNFAGVVTMSSRSCFLIVLLIS
jgi:hypothetical protein